MATHADSTEAAVNAGATQPEADVDELAGDEPQANEPVPEASGEPGDENAVEQTDENNEAAGANPPNAGGRPAQGNPQTAVHLQLTDHVGDIFNAPPGQRPHPRLQHTRQLGLWNCLGLSQILPRGVHGLPQLLQPGPAAVRLDAPDSALRGRTQRAAPLHRLPLHERAIGPAQRSTQRHSGPYDPGHQRPAEAAARS